MNKNEQATNKYPVMEIFDSIQGEGGFMGVPCTFVRFAGCNLACPFCDTKESWGKPNYDRDFKVTATSDNPRELLGYRWMSIEEIQESCKQHLVVLTGGEPCQYNLEPLIEALRHDQEHYVAIETNGTLPTPKNADWITMSPKEVADYAIAEMSADEIKIVVTEEFNPMDARLDEIKTFQGNLWLQPDGNHMEECWRKCIEILPLMGMGARVGVQLHKIINVK